MSSALFRLVSQAPISGSADLPCTCAGGTTITTITTGTRPVRPVVFE